MTGQPSDAMVVQKAAMRCLAPELSSEGQASSLVMVGPLTKAAGGHMDTFWGVSATGWTAIYTLLTAGLLIVAVAAAWYAKGQWTATRESVEDARRASREATRPYVIVTIEPTATSRTFFDLCVRNIGQRPALDVSVRLDPPPVRADETSGLEIAKVKMLNEPVAMIAPGQEMRAFYDSHAERVDAKNVPTVHRVFLEYVDSSGHPYTEESVLDLDAMRGAMYTEEKTVHHVAKRLEEITKVLKSSSLLGRRGGLTVDAVTEPRQDRDARVEREEYERNVARLDIIRQATPNSPTIAGLERRVAAYEDKVAEAETPGE